MQISIHRLILYALLATPLAAQSNPLVFEDVTVIPMTQQMTLPGQTVVVRDGQILAIGTSGSVAIPEGATRISGSEKFLMPGLADMHVHLERLTSEQDLKLFILAGVTMVRGMDGRPEHLDWRRRVAAGELTGPVIWTAGPIIDGDPAFWDDTVSVKDVEEARRAVQAQSKAGYDFIKIYHQLDRLCYEAILDEAQRLRLRVAGHVPIRVGLDQVFLSGQDCIEHLHGYARQCETDDSPMRNVWHWSKLYFAMPISPGKVAKAAAQTAEAEIWNCPTLVVNAKHEAMQDIEALLDDEQLRVVPTSISEQWDPASWDDERRTQFEQRDDEDYETIARGNANARAIVRALLDAGAELILGTDTPNPFVIPGAAVHEELGLLVKAGLTPYQALRTATIDAARFVNMDEPWGQVMIGGRADLLLLDANPLSNISNTNRIAGVMTQGHWFSRERLRELRRELEH